MKDFESPRRPFLNMSQALFLSDYLFGLKVADVSTVKELESYEDRNFYLKGEVPGTEGNSSPSEFVLKVTNHCFSNQHGLISSQSLLMQFLADRGFKCPRPVQSRFGTTEVMCKIPKMKFIPTCEEAAEEERSELPEADRCMGLGIYAGEEYDPEKFDICAVRLLPFIPGRVLCDVPWTAELLYNMGRWIGRVSSALQDFDHHALDDRDFLWDLRNTPLLEKYVHAVSCESHAELVLQVCRRFKNEVLPKLADLEKHTIHGDINEHNIIISCGYGDSGIDGNYEFGLIDFGDAVKSYRFFDIATSLMYVMAADTEFPRSRLEAAGQVLAGYQSTYPLSKDEVNLLYVAVAARFCQSLVIGAYTHMHLDPGNEYLLYTAKKGWKTFEDFLGTSEKETLRIWHSVALSRGVVLSTTSCLLEELSRESSGPRDEM